MLCLGVFRLLGLILGFGISFVVFSICCLVGFVLIVNFGFDDCWRVGII